MALALDDYGAAGYEVRAYKTRNGALRDAAKAIQATNSPVILLAWRGAHTWVMTGFRADADPVGVQGRQGVRRLRPRPLVSARLEHLGSLRPAGDVPGHAPRWSATTSSGSGPEGQYQDRDGLYISVVPTLSAP